MTDAGLHAQRTSSDGLPGGGPSPLAELVGQPHECLLWLVALACGDVGRLERTSGDSRLFVGPSRVAGQTYEQPAERQAGLSHDPRLGEDAERDLAISACGSPSADYRASVA